MITNFLRGGIGMKLAFLFHPVKDLHESQQYYEGLGMTEAWREGNQVLGMSMKDCEVQLMIEEDEHDLGPGGVFLVDSVDDFYHEHEGKLNFVKLPCTIPPGRYAIYRDATGNPIRIIDSTNKD
jgi:catechol 2,3-dioxygenase-like lactoylglutathione lyase family enzyme